MLLSDMLINELRTMDGLQYYSASDQAIILSMLCKALMKLIAKNPEMLVKDLIVK